MHESFNVLLKLILPESIEEHFEMSDAQKEELYFIIFISKIA
jgi:hypothetical protein